MLSDYPNKAVVIYMDVCIPSHIWILSSLVGVSTLFSILMSCQLNCVGTGPFYFITRATRSTICSITHRIMDFLSHRIYSIYFSVIAVRHVFLLPILCLGVYYNLPMLIYCIAFYKIPGLLCITAIHRILRTPSEQYWFRYNGRHAHSLMPRL